MMRNKIFSIEREKKKKKSEHATGSTGSYSLRMHADTILYKKQER